MINITQDIQSLTDFKKNTADFVTNLRKSGRPTILTVNGKAELVVIDAKAYQKMREQLEFNATISQIDHSLEDFEAKKFSSSQKVFSDLKKRITKPKSKSKHR